ncbi:MAG: hypothetical protein LBE38_06025 [Deltaproteobacteria bacterium]|jgi:uncharacterized membrane protein|nr:hypothetical protein [Deltaproteobacteria bacterium]
MGNNSESNIEPGCGTYIVCLLICAFGYLIYQISKLPSGIFSGEFGDKYFLGNVGEALGVGVILGLFLFLIIKAIAGTINAAKNKARKDD